MRESYIVLISRIWLYLPIASIWHSNLKMLGRGPTLGIYC